MILRTDKTYNANLTENFKVKEYFFSHPHPEWAYNVFKTCDDYMFNNIRLLALIQQNARDHANETSAYAIRLYNSSGVRNEALNTAAGGADDSYHLKGMSVDFHCGENNNYLTLIYDYLQDGIIECLKPSQVILYQDWKGHAQWIHITVPQPGIKQMAWIEEI
jgi:hypothetical protein